MIRHFLIIFLLLLLTVLADAQKDSTTGNAGTIRGTVIDAKTSQPLAGAAVALHNLQAGGAWNSATTGADGSFVFQGIIAGRYELTASHNGYVGSHGGRAAFPRAKGTTVSVNAGEDVDGVILRLSPTGVITGHITNERDEPMPGVLVETMKASYASGHREFSDARTGFTDDRGEFRIWGLAPGEYFLKATNPRTWGRGPSPVQVYVPMFYPGVFDPAQSQSLALQPGEELTGINLNLTAQRTVHVKGRVLSSNGIPVKSAEVTLLQFGGSGYSMDSETDAEGKFDLASVPPGSYVLESQSAENPDSVHVFMGRTTVVVGEAPVDGVDVTLFPGATISGHVRLEGDRKVAMPRAMVSLRPLTSSDSAVGGGSVALQTDGSFTIYDVLEGEYRLALSALPDGYYVKSARDTGDVVVLVSHGHAAPVEVRLSPGAGRLTGTVYKDKDNQQAAASATVVLIPDAARRSNSEYYRLATTDRSGNFVLPSISPGDYSLLALEEIERGAYMDPEFIQRYEAVAKPVHVEEQGNFNLQLQLATPTQDAPQ